MKWCTALILCKSIHTTKYKHGTSVYNVNVLLSPLYIDIWALWVLIQITSKLLAHGYRYYKLRKTFGKFFRSYSGLLSKFGGISFKEYDSVGISHPVFYCDLVYKLRRVKCEVNFVSSGSEIAKRLRRRNYDQVIIKRTLDFVLGPSTALYRSFLKQCTLTNKAVGTIWRTCPNLFRGDNVPIVVPSDYWSGLL